jgi:hypothetical protein
LIINVPIGGWLKPLAFGQSEIGGNVNNVKVNHYSEQSTQDCHTRESGYPEILFLQFSFWIPSSEGMTNNRKLKLKPI